MMALPSTSMAEHYEPDEQDEIIGDAMALGGPAFIQQLHDDSAAAAELIVPWTGLGAEPPGYWEAWIIAARRVLAERRAGWAYRRADHALGPSSAPVPAGSPITFWRRYAGY